MVLLGDLGTFAGCAGDLLVGDPRKEYVMSQSVEKGITICYMAVASSHIHEEIHVHVHVHLHVP